MKNMKSFFFCAVLIATSIIFTSCSKEKTIIGSWTLTVATQSYSDIEVLTGEEIWTFFTSDYYKSNVLYNDTKVDGEFTISYYGATWKGVWGIDGNSLTLITFDESEEYNSESTVEEYTILSLKKDEMSLCAEYGTIYDFVKVK